MKRVLTLATALFLLSCRDQGPADELLQHREIWRSHELANYDFEYSVGCFCIGSSIVRIEVRNHVATKISVTSYDEQTGDSTTTVGPTDPSVTMEWIFEKGLEAKRTADGVRFKFDALYGYPTEMNVDQFVQYVDDEYYWSISVTKILK